MPDTALRTPKLLSIVAPVYNEQELVEEFVARACAAAADYGFVVLQTVRQAGAGRPRAELGRLPAARPAGAGRPAGDDRALALPARHDRVGRLQPDGGVLRTRRTPRGRDEVHRAQDAALLAR